MSNPSPMTRVLRALLTVALITTGVTTTALASSPRRSETPTEGRVPLGAVNVLRGNQTGYVEVSLSRPVTIDAAEPNSPGASINSDITVRGAGRFVGVALVEDPFPGGRSPEKFFLAGRFRGCDATGCRAGKRTAETMFDLQSDGEETLRLESGDYRVYLLADGAPAEIEFRLNGLRGRTSLAATEDALMDLKTPPTRIDVEPNGDRIWSAGSSFEGGQVGFSLSWLELQAKNFSGTEIGICQYNAFEPPPEAVAYGPHCSLLTPALGSGGEVTFDSDIDADTFSLLASFGYHDNTDGTFGAPNLSGKHGLGAWIRSPQRFEVLPFRGFFLTIE